MSRKRIAVLASGGGSNLQSLIDHLDDMGDQRGGDIVLVASDRSDAGALARAQREGITIATIVSRRAPDGEQIAALLDLHQVDLLVLAGYLQLVPADVTRAFAGRLLNVHPGPLPEFGGPGMYGARVHRAVLAAHVPFSGPTVHFVDEQYDHGATIAHWAVPVRPTDDDHKLAARVLRAEHLLFPRVVQAVAAGRIGLNDAGRPTAPFFREDAVVAPMDPSLDDATLARILDAACAH
ncbi:MAG: phosphoribosylglycinamide formyltransferase [bacterium]